MNAKDKIKKLKKHFRCLTGWKIHYDSSVKDKAKSSINTADMKAIIYSYGKRNVPQDYYLHEILHCAVSSLKGLDKRFKKQIRQEEEELIQDICELFLKRRKDEL